MHSVIEIKVKTIEKNNVPWTPNYIDFFREMPNNGTLLLCINNFVIKCINISSCKETRIICCLIYQEK